MSSSEWDALPWHEQRTLLEGWELEQQANDPDREDDDEPLTSTTTHGSGEDAVAALLG